MRVVVWGINYAPEFTGISPHNVALCEFLRARGHDVEMVTTFSYYPNWEKRPEDRGQLYRTDVINGVSVHRCWHFVPRKVSAAKRILHEASFILTSTFRILSLGRPDVYVAVSPPLLLGAASWLVGAIKGAPFVFHVQDMQPDAAVGLGMLRDGWFIRALYALEAFAYEKAARVSGITRGMLVKFRRKGVPEAKLLYFPNAIGLTGADAIPARGTFRNTHGIPAEKFVAIYAGNLGVKQGANVLIEAAQLLQDPRIHILICGDGAQRDVLAERVRTLGLPNVSLLPLQQGQDYLSLLEDADLCFVTQQSGSGNSFFPSKLLGLLAQSKPVITVADEESELAAAVSEGGFGLNIAPGQPQVVAEVLDRMASDRARLAEWGAAGRVYVQQFDKTHVFENFLKELEAL
jgi:colanic acid biosynthesis glycosyl transferase WcaI